MSETDIEAALTHLRSLPYRNVMPKTWDRKNLLDMLREAIDKTPEVGHCYGVTPGVFAIIKPFGMDLIQNNDNHLASFKYGLQSGNVAQTQHVSQRFDAMPANILNLSAYTVTNIEETEHDYHINAETKASPQKCPHCYSDNLVGFGRNEQLGFSLKFQVKSRPDFCNINPSAPPTSGSRLAGL